MDIILLTNLDPFVRFRFIEKDMRESVYATGEQVHGSRVAEGMAYGNDSMLMRCFHNGFLKVERRTRKRDGKLKGITKLVKELDVRCFALSDLLRDERLRVTWSGELRPRIYHRFRLEECQYPPQVLFVVAPKGRLVTDLRGFAMQSDDWLWPATRYDGTYASTLEIGIMTFVGRVTRKLLNVNNG